MLTLEEPSFVRIQTGVPYYDKDRIWSELRQGRWRREHSCLLCHQNPSIGKGNHLCRECFKFESRAEHTRLPNWTVHPLEGIPTPCACGSVKDLPRKGPKFARIQRGSQLHAYKKCLDLKKRRILGIRFGGPK